MIYLNTGASLIVYSIVSRQVPWAGVEERRDKPVESTKSHGNPAPPCHFKLLWQLLTTVRPEDNVLWSFDLIFQKNWFELRALQHITSQMLKICYFFDNWLHHGHDDDHRKGVVNLLRKLLRLLLSPLSLPLLPLQLRLPSLTTPIERESRYFLKDFFSPFILYNLISWRFLGGVWKPLLYKTTPLVVAIFSGFFFFRDTEVSDNNNFQDEVFRRSEKCL